MGKQPLANSLPKTANEKETLYPLSLSWCNDCNLIQLNHTVDPKILFSNYVWVTGNSGVTRKYAEYFYKQIRSRSNIKNGYVLEIASNDGTFLKPFLRGGYRVLGIDPAKNISRMANKNGVPTKCLFFGSGTAKKMVKKYGQADILFARNVLPHVANTRDFVEGLALCLKDNGTLAIEVHYAKKILEELHYDSIYHEHLCYFTLKSLGNLLNDFGLHIYDIGTSPISGGSIVVYVRKNKSKEKAVVSLYKKNESQKRTNDLKSWQNFARKSYEHKEELVNIISEAGRQGLVAGYGASARSSTLLNFCGINNRAIKVIADLNPIKQGRFTAGTRIPIASPEAVIKINRPSCVVILGWNFADEIIDNLRKNLYYKGRLIIPLPHKPRLII